MCKGGRERGERKGGVDTLREEERGGRKGKREGVGE